MSDIYDQYRTAFAQVSAYVILKDDERVATVAFKFPRDGAARLYAYVHWIGIEMVRGYAGGYGYDKRSAAVANAARKLVTVPPEKGNPSGFIKFVAAIEKDDGEYWDRRLQDAGFTVHQAV